MNPAPLLWIATLLGPGAEPEQPVPAWIRCTPTTVQAPGSSPQSAKNPIARALEEAGPGTHVYLDPGRYPAFTIGFRSNSKANASTSGGLAGAPIVVEGGPGVRIVGKQGDTIAIDQAVPNGWITFRRIEIVPGNRSGVLFFRRSDGRTHDGYAFEDCHILGQFDPQTGKGRRAKWGVWGHRMSDFRFVGTREPARIERISEEHAFYLQNPAGPILIENVHAQDLGRTFCQFTARSTEGPPGVGDITVRNCVVEDACIAAGDGYKGGSAFTVAGRLQGLLIFEDNVYRAGFRAQRRKLTTPDMPYGTGAFMAWEAGGEGRNGTLILRGNDFRFAEGCGDRPVVSIGGCEGVLIVGKNHFESGGLQPVLALDPVTKRGRRISAPNGRVYIAPQTSIKGRITLLGKPPTDEERTELQRRGPRKKPDPPPPEKKDDEEDEDG